MKKIYLSVFCLLTSFILKAKESPTMVTADSTEKKSPLTFNGFVDTYYFGNFNSPKSMSNLGGFGTARVLDQKAGQFQVGFVDFKATYSTEKVDGVIELAFGNHADLGNYGNPVSVIPGVTSSALAIKQAYLTWKMTSNFSITAGQYSTHVGYEILDSPVNYNFSLGNLFGNQPFYHTGIKATYAVSSKVSLMAGVVNALDSKDAFGGNKGFGAQVTIAPASGFAFYLNYLSADKNTGLLTPLMPTIAPVNYSVFDIVANMQVSPAFYLGANLDFGSVDSKSWSGYALYTNYVVSSKFGLGARFDHVDNKNAAALTTLTSDGKGTSVTSFTLTGNITISENLLLKPEFRLDNYAANATNKEQFEDSNGKFVNTSQSTFGAAFIFHF
jgi:hypothetical protein